MAPKEPLVLFTLAKAFHYGYLPNQADLCMKKLREHQAFSRNSEKWVLPVEVFIKCDSEKTKVMFDEKEIGICPVRIAGVFPGIHTIEWILQEGQTKALKLPLKEGTTHKIRYHPSEDRTSEEVSRDGLVTVYSPNQEPITLPELVKNYLVDDLFNLPKPSVSEIVSLIKN
ncbi:hypothetical protein HYY75_02910 [bacterium]|nr:hypothetical protein [bacterium]